LQTERKPIYAAPAIEERTAVAGAKGTVILLVGPSCAGKSTLAEAVQALSAQPYVMQSLDSLFAAIPEGWGAGGEHTLDGFRYDWPDSGAERGGAVRRIACGPAGWSMLRGFHRSVAAYADAGVNVVVDDMLLSLDVLADWAHALEAVPTVLVSVTAPKPELLRREAARQLHPTPGLVAGHFDLHDGVVADVRIDTSRLTPPQAARAVLDLASSAGRTTALRAFRPPS
jgi:chloramphenicol 3-O phosphotransferase